MRQFASQSLLPARRGQILRALLFFTLLALTPVSARAQDDGLTVSDPNDLFTIVVPDTFTEEDLIRFEDITSEALPGLQNDYGYLFADADEGDNAIGVLFLLLDEDIQSTADWLVFTDNVLASFFADDLELLDSTIGGVSDFTRQISGDSRGDLFVVDLIENDGLVTMLIGAADSANWTAMESQLRAAIASAEWSPETVRAYLDPDEDDGTTPTLEHYIDGSDVLSLLIPTGYELDEVDTSDGYGLTFLGPDEENGVIVGVLPASEMFAEAGIEGVGDQPLTDDEWEIFLDLFVEQMMADVTPDKLEAGQGDHTLFALVDADESEEVSLVLWVEEADGLIALLALIEPPEMDDVDASVAMLDEMIASFAWSPARVRAVMRDAAGEDATFAFDDPFGAVDVSLPAALPFESVELAEDGFFYSFLAEDEAGALFVAIDDIDASLTPEEWQTLVDETVPTFGNLVQSVDPEDDPEVVDLYVDENENYAALELAGDRFYGLIELQEVDGILATVMLLAPVESWEDQEFLARETLYSIDWDADAARDIIAADRERTASLIGSGFDASSNIFAGDEAISFTAEFDEESLDGLLSLHLYEADGTLAVLSTQPALSSADDEGNVAATFTISPSPLRQPGKYLAELRYDGALLGQYPLSILAAEAVEPGIYAPTLGLDSGLMLDIFYPDEEVVLQGRGDFAEGSQLRAVWSGPDGVMRTGNQSAHFDADRLFDGYRFSFLPENGWQPGLHALSLLLDGEELWSSAFDVVEGVDEYADVLDGPPITAENAAQVEWWTDGFLLLSEPEPMAVSPDGRWVAVGSPQSGIELFTADLLESLTLDGLADRPVTALAFSPDSRLLAVAGVGEVDPDAEFLLQIWDIERQNLLSTLLGHTGAINDIAFSPDGETLASASSDGSVRLWTLAGGDAPVLLIAPDADDLPPAVLRLAFDPNGAHLAAGNENGEVHLWQAADGQLMATLDGLADPVNAVSFAQELPMLAASSETSAKLWAVGDSETPHVMNVAVDSGESIRDLALSPDGDVAVLAVEDLDGNGEVRFVGLSEDEAPVVLHALPVEGVRSIEFGPDGATLFTLGTDIVSSWIVGDGETE